MLMYLCRVQGLKFQGEDQSDLNDILQRVSAFGLFVYAVFSVIAGSLTAMTSEPNLLVMITGNLAVVQVFFSLYYCTMLGKSVFLDYYTTNLELSAYYSKLHCNIPVLIIAFDKV